MTIDLNSPDILFAKDKNNHLIQILHWPTPFTLPEHDDDRTPSHLATVYMGEASGVFESAELIGNLNTPPATDLNRNFTELRLSSQVENSGYITFFYAQTYFGIPMWLGGMTVAVKPEPLEIRRATSTVDHSHIEISRPATGVLNNYKNITKPQLAALLNITTSDRITISDSETILIYKYQATERFHVVLPEGFTPPGFNPAGIPGVSSSIRDNDFCIVRQVLFSVSLNWRCFIELNTGSILYLEAFISCATGMVMISDPITQGGLASQINVDNSTNADLNPFQQSYPLPVLRLDPVDANGNQHLRGQYARVIDPVLDANDPLLDPFYPGPSMVPNPTPPVKPTPFAFDFDVRTEEFAAVNAYFHVDRFLDFMVNLGLQLKPTSLDPTAMLPNTVLPIRVDHRAYETSATIPTGGGCVGNLANNSALGIAFARISPNVLGNPDFHGQAYSYRYMLHELSHVLLLDHIASPNFTGFTHSFGDSLAAILNDPLSTLAPPSTSINRFATFPWENTSASPSGVDRWHNRDTNMAAGWYWGGSQDTGSGYYNSEQLLSTTLFNAYRALGGDSIDVARRTFASRMIVAILLKTIRYYIQGGNATLHTSAPTVAAGLAIDMQYRDMDLASDPPVSVDNVRMGTSHKVIRWAFEKMAAFNQPSLTPPTSFQIPNYDIYIDDGRHGEYGYLENFWSTTDIVNRLQADGQTNFTHQNPVSGVTNYLYVKVKNRGYWTSQNVYVDAYRCAAGGGNVWPQDWLAINTAPYGAPGGIPTGGSQIVGPIAYTIPFSLHPHLCFLVRVQAIGDPSNTHSTTASSVPIPDFHLIPNDNNIAQRNVTIVAGYDGSVRIPHYLNLLAVQVLNPFTFKIHVTMEVHLPKFIVDKGWRLDFTDPGGEFDLDAFDREGVHLYLILTGEAAFTREDLLDSKDRDIIITMRSDHGVIGGITFYLDPDLR